MNGRVHPNCVNASNPYHECGVACLEKIERGEGQKDKKKSGSILQATFSFGKKKKGSELQSKSSPLLVPNVSPSPPSAFSGGKKVESESSHSFSSSKQHSDGSLSEDHSFDKGQVQPSEDHSFNKGQVQPSESVPVSGHLALDRSNSPSNGSFTSFAIATPTKQEENGKLRASHRASSFPFVNDVGKVTNDPVVRALNFNLSGTSGASEESDEEEMQSVISESCVSIGKYHVRQNIASILQLIFDKYGDIAGSSPLESTSMRAYYLECLCSVVQELQSTPFKQLTKSKLKEMFAVLKDLESARIDVSWLQVTLNEIAQAMELYNQHQAAEMAKADCSHALGSARKELESLMEDLEQKEKAIADTKAQVAEARTRLKGLELESSQLNDTTSSIWSKIEEFHSKPLADEIL